ncbi:MAG TPA: hypothetical protein VFT37_13020, partial [Telluria sp.]|nr:hypothetical protein [Telluria sp.]
EADIWTPRSGRALSEDGFAELRAQLETQSKRYTGKVLLVDSAPLDKGERPEIEWRRNVGHLSLGSSSVQVKVTPGEDTHFSLVKPEAKAKAKN